MISIVWSEWYQCILGVSDINSVEWMVSSILGANDIENVE